MIFDNPLLERYRKSTARPAHLLIYFTIYTMFIVLIGLINSLGLKYQEIYETKSEFYQSLYFQFLCLELLILWGWTTYNSSSAIREEITGNSYDFFKLLPMSASGKAIGILIGKSIVPLLFAGLSLIGMIILGKLAGLANSLQWQIIFCLIATSFLTNTTGLLGSLQTPKRTNSSNTLLTLLVLFFGLPLLVNITIAIADNIDIYQQTWTFYKWKLPILTSASLISIYLGIWAFIGILRKFKYELEPIFTPIGAKLFLSFTGIILLGFVIKDIKISLSFYWLFLLLILLAVAFASCKNLFRYIENMTSNIKRGQAPSLLFMIKQSNVTLAIQLFVLYSGFVLIASYLGKMILICSVKILIITLSSYLFLMLLYELYVLFSPSISKITILLGFLAILYMILPLILSAIVGNSFIYTFSPIGTIAMLINKGYNSVNDIFYPFVTFHLIILLIPALIVLEKYKKIVKAKLAN